MEISPGHFVAYPDQARDLFCQSVGTIEIEISSYCNRRCGFCPNSTLDRISGQTYMDDALFRSIVVQLGKLQWSGTLSFHRYNEPLADRPYLLRRLHEAHSLAPTATLCLFTNGDYLTRDYLDAIYDAGCRHIICSVYLQEGKPYDDAEMRAAIERRIDGLALDVTWVSSEPGLHVARVHHRDMDIIMRGQDFYRPVNGLSAMSNRGGILDANAQHLRTEPCIKPIIEMQIEVDGTLMPCCELRSDYAGHQASRLGRLRPQDDIVSVWAGPTYTKWRRALFSFAPKSGICAGCAAPGIGTAPDVRRMVDQVHKAWIGG